MKENNVCLKNNAQRTLLYTAITLWACVCSKTLWESLNIEVWFRLCPDVWLSQPENIYTQKQKCILISVSYCGKKKTTLFPWSLNQTLHSSLLYQWSALHLGRDIFLSLLQKIIMLPDEARSWNSALTLQQLKGTAYRISQHLTVKLYTVLILIFVSIIISITSASRTDGGALRHRNQAVFASRQPHRCETLVNRDRKYMWAAPPWIIR